VETRECKVGRQCSGTFLTSAIATSVYINIKRNNMLLTFFQRTICAAILTITLGCSVDSNKPSEPIQVTKDLIERLLPDHHNQMMVEFFSEPNEDDRFEIESVGDKLVFRCNIGVSVVSALRFYQYTVCSDVVYWICFVLYIL